MPKNITVMGSGNTGLSTALKLKNDGHNVCLFELPEFSESTSKMKENLSLSLLSEKINLKLDLITNDANQAAEYSKIIILCVPAYAHHSYAKILSGKVTNEHIVVLMPGTLGSLELKSYFLDNNSEIPIIGETDTSPFVCRKTGNSEAVILGEVPNLGIGIMPKSKTAETINVLSDFFTGLVSYEDVLECGLSSLNPVMHPAGVILNAGRIEKSEGEFFFYNEGITESVSGVIESVDLERRKIGDFFGYKLDKVADSFHKAGFGQKGTLIETISSSDMLTSLKAPGVINHRWLTEDISYGIYTWSAIGEKFEINTHTMKTLIEMGSILLKKDLKKTGRKLKDLGIEKMTLDEIKNYL